MQITTSPNISNLEWEFQLDIAQQVPKAIITDISTYIGAGANNIIGMVVRIIDPSNLALPQTTYPPNVDIQPGLTDTEKNLPYFNGKVKWGTYKAYLTLIDQDGTEYVWEDDDGTQFKSINLCQPNALSNATKNYGGLLLNVDPNCDLGMLIVQDGGTGFTYNGVSPAETEAALIITYPIDTTGTVSQKTATFIPFTFPLTVSGFYTIQGTVTQTYQLTSTTSVKAAYYYQKQFDVMCGYSLCKALCDYERLWQEIKECSIANPNQLTQKMRVFMLITGLIVKSIAFKNCGKKFGDLLEQFRIIGGFTCECECAPQGISPAPLFMSGGTIVKGNMCGDIDLTLTQFEGNFQLNLSDITYEVIAAASQSSWFTVTPLEGTCSMTYQLSLNVCAMLDTVSIGCLSDVDVSSPPPSDGQVLTWNEDLEVWEPGDATILTVLYNDQSQHDLTNIGQFNSYTIEAGAISNDGDQIEFDTFFFSDQAVADTPTIAFQINGSTVLSLGFLSNTRGIKMHVKINRVDDANSRIDISYQFLTAPSFTIYPIASDFFIPPTALALNFNNAITLSTRFTVDSATAITMSNLGFAVKHFKAGA